MRQKTNMTKGSSMLLAICIFLLLTVVGINVLASAQSNVQTVKTRYETEQTMQYMNSIYEILDEKIQNGVFVLDGYLSSGEKEQEVSKTDRVKLKIGTNEEVQTYISFWGTGQANELKAKIYMEYKGVPYFVTSLYEYKKAEGSAGTYELIRCEGVTSGEEQEEGE